MRSLRAQIVAALAAVALLLPSTAFARTQFFCHMMNRVVAACCCDTDSNHEEDPSCTAQVRATDCCERISVTTRSTTTLKATGTEISVPSAAVASIVPAAVYVFPRTVEGLTVPEQARAPPIVGPPLFLVHCSLLT